MRRDRGSLTRVTNAANPTEAMIVTICKQNLHGVRACWQAHPVRHDADGLWLFTPAGSTFRFSDGTTDERCEVEGYQGPGMDSLVLVPVDSESWLACWHVPARELHINVEICGWVRRDADVIAFEDWELDPFRLRSGLVAVEDVDDFVEARAAGLLDADRAERALVAAAGVERSLRQESAPFDGRGDRLLAECGRLGLPALVDVPHPFDL